MRTTSLPMYSLTGQGREAATPVMGAFLTSILPCEHMFFNKISILSERNDRLSCKKAEGEWLAVGRVRKLPEFSTLSMDRQREVPSWSGSEFLAP